MTLIHARRTRVAASIVATAATLTLAVGSAPVSSAPAAPVARGPVPGKYVPDLILWNHLGTAEQLAHSETGGPLRVTGTERHPVAVRGAGSAAVGDDSYLSVSRRGFFGADRTQGAVEIFLEKRMRVSVPFKTSLPAIFGVRPYAGRWGPIDAYWSDGFTGYGGLQFEIVDAAGKIHAANDLGWDRVKVGHWVHVMFVWDIRGIAGTADRLRIYRDGTLVATNTDEIKAIGPAKGPVPVLATHAYARLGRPALVGDELLTWSRPQTP